MTQTSWPFRDPSTGGTPVYEDQWSLMARQWAASGVVGYPGDAGLQVYANGSGREVHVRAGLACVRGHWFRSDTQETLAIAANTSGNPRIDRVVVRLDPSADSATLAVLTGTPAGSPSAPTLTTTDTGVYELTLARVSVADGAATITAGNVLDERVQVAPPALMGSSTRRPQNPINGQEFVETDTGLLLRWAGSDWVEGRSSRIKAGRFSGTTNASGAVTIPTEIVDTVSSWAFTYCDLGGMPLRRSGSYDDPTSLTLIAQFPLEYSEEGGLQQQTVPNWPVFIDWQAVAY